MKKTEKGITLIALVVTIIVLIILAGISINLILGENGIITKAQEAKQAQEKAEIIENLQLEIAAKEAEKLQNTNGITVAEIEEILGKYGTVNKNDDGEIESLTPTDKGYEIPFEEIYGGELEKPLPTALPTDGSYSEAKKVNTPKINESQGMKLATFNTSTKTWGEDTTKSDYNYVAGEGTADNTSSRWANAIVTKDGIESLFVWIPRYAYKIDSTNKTIDVKFIQGTGILAVDGVTVCKYADDSTLTADDYIIHPAFTSNADLGGGFGEIPGLWVGKFETSRSNAEATSVGDSTTLKVAPSVKSWVGITIGEMYTHAKAYNTNLYSHMAKNSEWGAVAYLTHSQYGRNGNEIAVNQCSSKITGAGPGEGSSNIYNSTYAYKATNFETTYSYTSEQGKKGSTTGNEYGIYDFSGGAYEYVASYYNDSTYSPSRYEAYASSFASKGGISNEYATVYTGERASRNYIKGDGTYETSGLNSGNAYFVTSSSPFFCRGGSFISSSNACSFGCDVGSGELVGNISFRVCLAVK